MKRGLRSLFTWYSTRSRTRKAELVSRLIDCHGLTTSILVGAAAPSGVSGIVETATATETRVVAACNLDIRETPWPYAVADGRALPFRRQSVDLIVSNAVVEHVGDEADQRRFLAEHARVARWSAVTTPNRWFPIESHTLTPLAHWLPSWRQKQTIFTRLLSLAEFRALLPPGTEVVGKPWSGTFTAFLPGDS